MVEKLALFYGEKICELNGETYYSFPSVNALSADKVEQILKNNGFGYRAKYISKSAKHINNEGGEKWIENLKQLNYDKAKECLMTLTGIGAKV